VKLTCFRRFHCLLPLHVLSCANRHHFAPLLAPLLSPREDFFVKGRRPLGANLHLVAVANSRSLSMFEDLFAIFFLIDFDSPSCGVEQAKKLRVTKAFTELRGFAKCLLKHFSVLAQTLCLSFRHGERTRQHTQKNAERRAGFIVECRRDFMELFIVDRVINIAINISRGVN
jgi:hypothetical protein